MYISGIGLTEKPKEKSKAAKVGGSGFSDILFSSDVTESQTTGTSSISNMQQLFFLQEVNDEGEQKKETVFQAFDALKYLDKIKMNLLSGNLSIETISNLEIILQKFKRNWTDPALSQIIDEIELRAKVEIAKLQS